MKKVLIYSLNFAPELTGIGKYNGEMASWLADKGFEVRVICAPPYYPAWAVSPPYRWYQWTREIISHVRVFRCPTWVPNKPSGLTRIIHLFSFATSSIPLLVLQLRWKPDIVWFVVPTLACAPSALLLGRLAGSKVWCHVQDFEVDAAFDLGIVKGRLFRRAILALEQWIYRHCDVVSTISSRMRDRAIAKGVDSEKVELVSNWVDMNGFQYVSPESLAAYRDALKLPMDKLIVLYSGNMGAKQGLEILPMVARTCWQSDLVELNKLHFVFCGEGPTKAILAAECEGLGNVTFLQLQPADNLPTFLSLAAIHLLPQKADAEDLVMPSKLTGMLASGRPVIATASEESELAKVLQGCGVLVPPGDHNAVTNALTDLARDDDLRNRLGINAKDRALECFDKEKILGRMVSHDTYQ